MGLGGLVQSNKQHTGRKGEGEKKERKNPALLVQGNKQHREEGVDGRRLVGGMVWSSGGSGRVGPFPKHMCALITVKGVAGFRVVLVS